MAERSTEQNILVLAIKTKFSLQDNLSVLKQISLVCSYMHVSVIFEEWLSVLLHSMNSIQLFHSAIKGCLITVSEQCPVIQKVQLHPVAGSVFQSAQLDERARHVLILGAASQELFVAFRGISLYYNKIWVDGLVIKCTDDK